MAIENRAQVQIHAAMTFALEVSNAAHRIAVQRGQGPVHLEPAITLQGFGFYLSIDGLSAKEIMSYITEYSLDAPTGGTMHVEVSSYDQDTVIIATTITGLVYPE